MSPLEQRLRQELPILAEALAEGRVAITPGEPGERSDLPHPRRREGEASVGDRLVVAAVGTGAASRRPTRRLALAVLLAAAAVMVAVTVSFLADGDGGRIVTEQPAGPVGPSAVSGRPAPTTTGDRGPTEAPARGPSSSAVSASVASTAVASTAVASTALGPGAEATTVGTSPIVEPPTSGPAAATAATSRPTTSRPPTPRPTTTRATGTAPTITAVPATTLVPTTMAAPAVTAPGGPLQLLNPGYYNVTAGSSLVIPMVVTGGDGSPLQFSATGLPPGMTIDPTTGRISGQPTAPGVYSIRVVVADRTASMNQGFTMELR